MGRIYTRKLPTARAPIHTCALPEPQYLPVERRDLSTSGPDNSVSVVELVPFGDWRPETVLHDLLRKKAGGSIGYRASEYFLENGRVFQRTVSRSNRDQ